MLLSLSNQETTENQMSTINNLLDIINCEDEKLKAEMIAEIEEASRLAYEQHQREWAEIKKKTKKVLDK